MPSQSHGLNHGCYCYTYTHRPLWSLYSSICSIDVNIYIYVMCEYKNIKSEAFTAVISLIFPLQFSGLPWNTRTHVYTQTHTRTHTQALNSSLNGRRVMGMDTQVTSLVKDWRKGERKNMTIKGKKISSQKKVHPTHVSIPAMTPTNPRPYDRFSPKGALR